MPKVNSVLLIDDDPINNFLNAELVKKLGVSEDINIAINGSQALQFIEERKENCPNLIFLDLNMPAIDGFEFLEIFLKMDIPEKSKVVILILTTSTNTRDLERIKHYGNYEFLSKPLKEEKLAEIISEYFGKNELAG